MDNSLSLDNNKSKDLKNQSFLTKFTNLLSKDLNKIAKKLPLPPILKKSKKKEFNREKYIKILEKRKRFLSRKIFEFKDFKKLSKYKILLSELNLLLNNKRKINDDEILEMYAKLRKKS